MTKSECGGRSSLVQPNTAEPLNELFFRVGVMAQLAKHWSPLLGDSVPDQKVVSSNLGDTGQLLGSFDRRVYIYIYIYILKWPFATDKLINCPLFLRPDI